MVCRERASANGKIANYLEHMSTTIKVTRFGTMQLTGHGVWGGPANHAEAIAVKMLMLELAIELFCRPLHYPQIFSRAFLDRLTSVICLVSGAVRLSKARR